MDENTRDILHAQIKSADKCCRQIDQDLNQDDPPREQIESYAAQLSQIATLIRLLIQRVA